MVKRWTHNLSSSNRSDKFAQLHPTRLGSDSFEVLHDANKLKEEEELWVWGKRERVLGLVGHYSQTRRDVAGCTTAVRCSAAVRCATGLLLFGFWWLMMGKWSFTASISKGNFSGWKLQASCSRDYAINLLKLSWYKVVFSVCLMWICIFRKTVFVAKHGWF